MAVVGGGFGAGFWWHQHPNCVVTGVSDLRPDRRERLRAHYKCDTVYDSLETMVKQARDIDAVAVFTEATNHEKHARMCMERGWHVVSCRAVQRGVDNDAAGLPVVAHDVICWVAIGRPCALRINGLTALQMTTTSA